MNVLDKVSSVEERQPSSQQDTGSNAADLLLITRLSRLTVLAVKARLHRARLFLRGQLAVALGHSPT